MSFTTQELRAFLDDEINRAIERIHARQLELEHESWALKAERERRRDERRRREVESNIRRGGHVEDDEP
jgi:hypothetical protein